MHTLYLIRGVPGCGKSDLAYQMVTSGMAVVMLEADQYFMDRKEIYVADIHRNKAEL